MIHLIARLSFLRKPLGPFTNDCGRGRDEYRQWGDSHRVRWPSRCYVAGNALRDDAGGSLM